MMRHLRDRLFPRRPAGVSRTASLRRAVPVMLLVASIGLAGLGAVHAQRSVRSHQATAETLLRDYGAFAAWSYRKAATDALWGAYHTALYPAMRGFEEHGSPVPLDSLLAYEARGGSSCGCSTHYGAPFYFYISVDTDQPIHAAGAVLPDAATLAWLEDSVRAHVSTVRQPEWKEAVLHKVIDGRDRYFVYGAYTCKAGQLHVYGFEMEPARYRPMFEKAIADNDILPPTLMAGRSKTDMLAIKVTDSRGGALFETDAAPLPEPFARDTFDASKGGLQVRAAVRPELAAQLIIGGLPRSRLPLLLVMFALSVALAAVAVGQLRREEELARLRTDFVSSASHELRTPLAQIRLFLETLRLGRYADETQREWMLDNAHRETTRLTNLINNVLHFSRSERGNGHGGRVETNLAVELRQIVEGFLPLAESRRNTIAMELADGVLADVRPESFRQLVLNLLDNAVKYGRVGQTVRVVLEAEGARARIAIEDQGRGVDRAERAQIFQPFRRGAHAIGSVAVGSGIGLAVVRDIAAQHEGSVRVEDAAGGGARFVFELPCRRFADLRDPATERAHAMSGAVV